MPTAPGYGDVSVKMQLLTMARPAYVTFGVDPTATDPLLVAADILNAWTFAGSINTLLDSSVTATEFTVRLGTDGGEDLIATQTNATVGGRSGTSVPPNVAVLLHKRTARGGRRGRGRMFLPWCVLGTDVGEDGIITPARVTAIGTAAAVFRNQLAAVSSPMVILHGPGATSMGAPDVVTSLTVSNLVATQRRRLGR
jgi:hypothetical protein